MDGELRRLVHALHFATDEAKPPDWQPDWEKAPLPFKLYGEFAAAFTLSAEVPLKLPPVHSSFLQAESGAPHDPPDLKSFGHFLWYAYGFTQVSRYAVADGQASGPGAASPPSFHRAVPSGGGLYPCEIYAFLKLPELPAGIYHYDAAHHRLLLLREGTFDDYLDRALGERIRTEEAFAVLFVTVCFLKNFWKYSLFSYRLQGLDAGVLLGQLGEAAVRFGFKPLLFGQFLDRALNHLLGLTEGEESVYAVMPLGACQPAALPFSGSLTQTNRLPALYTAAQLIREIPALTLRYSFGNGSAGSASPHPLLLRMHQASMQEGTDEFRSDPGEDDGEAEAYPVIPLPDVSGAETDLAALTRRRYTPETDFTFRPVALFRLSRMLRRAASPGGFCDLDPAPNLPRLSRNRLIFGTFSGVEGLEPGAYRYDAASHSLELVRPGDHRDWLQYGMLMNNVNLRQAPMCFHIAGDRRHGLNRWGARGYRLQQMEAGMRTQKLLLAAAAEGWGGRPLLSYDAEAVDDLYRLPPAGVTALMQIPAGPYRHRARWTNRLHC